MFFRCCIGNIYRKEWKDRVCVVCFLKFFIDFVMMLRGYYCEKGDELVVGELFESFLNV